MNPLRRGPDAVSPTAHYTGHVWVRNGLSHPELATRQGRLFFDALRPLNALNRAAGGATLEGSLLARHVVIDAALTEAIEDGSVAQVIEVAAGMSPRGWRFSRRYGDRLAYVEADLPAMARSKREALERIGPLGDHHRVVEIDALRDDGPQSLAAIAEALDPAKGLAVITEGLLTYLERESVLALWRRIATVSARFSAGLYLADLRLSGDAGRSERAFYVGLSAFVRGSVHMHFAEERDALAALREAGFTQSRLRRGDSVPGAPRDPGAGLIRVVDARTRPAATASRA